MWVPNNSGNRSGSCSENCGFRIAQVVGCHSENGILHSENGISHSESCSENTLELSESSENGLFTPRAFFLKLGWSPARLPKIAALRFSHSHDIRGITSPNTFQTRLKPWHSCRENSLAVTRQSHTCARRDLMTCSGRSMERPLREKRRGSY